MKIDDVFINYKYLHKYVYIGYSGGIDSGVLLDLCCKFLRNKHILKVIHVNHSYNDQSNRWLFFCRNVCDAYNIILYTYTIKNKMYIDNIEETLRVCRFNFFLKSVIKNTSLLLAHHNNDLIETFIMRLFRGCGVSVASGMKYKTKMNYINVVRPFLSVTKLDIINYAIFNKVNFVVDNSNYDVNFRRNYIRFCVEPFLKEKLINKLLIIKHLRLTDNIIRYINKFLFCFIKSPGFKYKAISLIYINQLSFFLFKELLRFWIGLNEYKMPSYNSLYEIVKLIRAKSFRACYVKINQYIIEKLSMNIYISEYVEKFIYLYDIFSIVYVCVFDSNLVIVYIKCCSKFILKKLNV